MWCRVPLLVCRDDRGFTLVELMTVLLLISILVLTAVPMYVSATARAEKQTCFQNQNTLERAAQVYLGSNLNASADDLLGPVNSSHPVVQENIVRVAPRCPSGQKPADPENPTAAEGGYTFEASATLAPCPLGSPAPHGSYQ